jgi:hypothetical protein
MAKRTSNRSQANDGSGGSAQSKARRSRAASGPAAGNPTSAPDVERTDNDDAALNAASGDAQPASAMSSETPSGRQAVAQTDWGTSSSSMASEPNDDDIRMRAYQRYVERGGGHGMDFEDWLEAERELKVRSTK